MTEACPYCKGSGRVTASLSVRLTTLRDLKGVTQAEVASAAGISRTQIANLERGRGEPSISSLIRLAAYFCVSTDYLLGVDNAKKGSADA
ncbi:helix-turn-helix domain-containing protein [Agrobacterium vitis]|uniref:helix-turn-helix domain-containing protein n=1 Tax=Agrobacterium vitis TaxID=373 RepID=UPI0012E73148|nr:helix-turn-helix transcriptional regulator [Agrobacterium vitis]MVB04204.1 helix-turn-helix domain-containing protein [Agrobacterium vitis]